MADILDVMTTLKNSIVALIAPYQPSVPPTFTNNASTAGTIVSTVVGIGHPTQLAVTERLENHSAQIAIIEGEVERVINDIQVLEAISSNGNIDTYEVGRSQKQIILQIWSYDLPTREAISKLLRSLLSDSFRQVETDGSVTLMRYANTIPFDMEQKDSIWIKQIHYMADYSVTQLVDTYAVTSIELETEVLTELQEAEQLGLIQEPSTGQTIATITQTITT